jgi:hypothetical protein
MFSFNLDYSYRSTGLQTNLIITQSRQARKVLTPVFLGEISVPFEYKSLREIVFKIFVNRRSAEVEKTKFLRVIA